MSKPSCGSVVELAVHGHWYGGAVAATVADTMGAAYTKVNLTKKEGKFTIYTSSLKLSKL